MGPSPEKKQRTEKEPQRRGRRSNSNVSSDELLSSSSFSLHLLSWGRIVSFLTLPEMLTCRLVSKKIGLFIRDGILPVDCALWLATSLQARNLLIIPTTTHDGRTSDIDGTIDSAWNHATNNARVLQHGFSFSSAPLQHATGANSAATTAHQAPLDCLLKCLRVCKYVPKEAAVVHSDETSRYGQHQIVPVQYSGNSSVSVTPIQYYDSCTRSDCTLCTSSSDVPNNLPCDLTCPCCGVDRTLLLSKITYKAASQSSSWGAGEDIVGHLSFDPNLDDSSSVADGGGGASQPATNEQSCFPPVAMDNFFGTTRSDGRNTLPSLQQKERIYCKHALTIHCTACRQFGLVGPAGLCCDMQSETSPAAIRRRPFHVCRGTHGYWGGSGHGNLALLRRTTTEQQGGTRTTTTTRRPVGYLSRTCCSTKGCHSAVPCLWCLSGLGRIEINTTPYCNQCRAQHEALSFHA